MLVQQPAHAVVADRRSPGERRQQVLIDPRGRQALGPLFKQPGQPGLAWPPRPPDPVGTLNPATAEPVGASSGARLRDAGEVSGIESAGDVAGRVRRKGVVLPAPGAGDIQEQGTSYRERAIDHVHGTPAAADIERPGKCHVGQGPGPRHVGGENNPVTRQKRADVLKSLSCGRGMARRS